MDAPPPCVRHAGVEAAASWCLHAHSTAQHSTAQHSTAPHRTPQHSTAQHSTAQHPTRAAAQHLHPRCRTTPPPALPHRRCGWAPVPVTVRCRYSAWAKVDLHSHPFTTMGVNGGHTTRHRERMATRARLFAPPHPLEGPHGAWPCGVGVAQLSMPHNHGGKKCARFGVKVRGLGRRRTGLWLGPSQRR